MASENETALKELIQTEKVVDPDLNEKMERAGEAVQTIQKLTGNLLEDALKIASLIKGPNEDDEEEAQAKRAQQATGSSSKLSMGR